MGSCGWGVAKVTQPQPIMARTKFSLFLIPLLCMASSIEGKNWRYWPNIGCFEFSFERTVFFELTNEATRLSAITGSELPAIVNTSIIPASNNELQLQHILAGSIKNSTTNTPEECIISCNATGFAYAGLQDGKRCVCMNEPPTAKADGNCNTPCPGNANFSCGGSWTMDLHQNPAYHSTNLTYIGCFKNTFNDLDRMLFEGTYNNFRNNTPDWCVAYCTSGGYDYAGLQYGSQCICTNSGPQGTSNAGQCTYGCAGDNSIKMCGGLGYINIFHTDAHKTTIDDYGCGDTVQDTYYQKWYNDMGHCGITPGAAGNGKSGRATERGGILLTVGQGYQFTSLDENKPLPSCVAGKVSMGRAFNSENFKPSVSLSPDGKIISCIGFYTKKKCRTYNTNNDTWTVTGELPEVMQHMASDYTPEVGLVVSGGNLDGGRGKHINSTYQSKDGGVTFNKLPDYPGPKPEAGCVVIVNDDEFFRLGGRFKNLPGNGWLLPVKDVYSYKFSTNQWTRKADMTYGGYEIVCGLVTTDSGAKEIVSVGDRGGRVEIYDIASNTWREGNKFPDPAPAQAASARYGDTFLVVGGLKWSIYNEWTRDRSNMTARDNFNSRIIYEYIAKDDTFRRLPATLTKDANGAGSESNAWMSAIVLPDNICG